MGYEANPGGGTGGGSWKWNAYWGTQITVQGFALNKAFVKLPVKPNVIHVKAIRLLVQSIIQRSLYHMTNRQAILLADSTFSRSGAAPGIAECLLLGGDAQKFQTAESRKDGKDVSRHILAEWERQICITG